MSNLGSQKHFVPHIFLQGFTCRKSFVATLSSSPSRNHNGATEINDLIKKYFIKIKKLNLFLRSPISSLKARAVLIDMEESVVECSQNSSIGELFDPSLSITSQSGSGNNWAVGFYEYGSRYRDQISG